MNWIAIIVAAIVNFALGFVWFSPPVLGNQWMKLLGKRRDELAQQGPGYAVVIVGTLVTAIVLAYLVKWTNTTTLINGAGLGLLVWLGFVGTGTAGNYVFEGRPWPLFGGGQSAGGSRLDGCHLGRLALAWGVTCRAPDGMGWFLTRLGQRKSRAIFKKLESCDRQLSHA